MKKVGALLILAAIIILPLLALGGVRIVTMKSVHVVDTGTSKTSLRLHWPVLVSALSLSLGLGLVLCPPRRDAIGGETAN